MNRFVPLLVAILFVTDGYNGEWTEYKSSKDGIENLIHMDENQTVSIQDPKFKQGVIDWVYDQLGPTLMKTYYQLPLDDQRCIRDGYEWGHFDSPEKFSELLKEELPAKSMKHVESNCPTLNETAAVLYKASYAFFMKQKEQVQNFTNDLPESMSSALVKMYNLTMTLYNNILDRNSYMDPYGPNSTAIEILEACEEFLNAPEEDRKTAAKNDTLWTSLFTGDLRDSSLELVRALKKFFVIIIGNYQQDVDREAQRRVYSTNIVIRNYQQDVDREALITTYITTYTSLRQAWRKWLKIAKSELLAYFETRTRPWTSDCLKPWFNACRSVPYYFYFSRDLGRVYNHNYEKWFDWYDY